MTRKILVLLLSFILMIPSVVLAESPQEAAELFTFSELSFETESAVTYDLAFIKSFKGCDITWSSSDESVVTADGMVIRPGVGEDAADVVITATLTAGTSSATREFYVTVLPYTSDDEIVEKIKYELTFDTLTNEAMEAVSKDLYLPATDENYGAVIRWESSNNAALRVVADGDAYKGIISSSHYSDGVYYVLLKATIIYNNSFAEKDFYVHTVEKNIGYSPAEKATAAAKSFEASFLRNNNINALRKDLVLPEISGVTVSYLSDNEVVVSNEGKVKRSIDKDEKVSFAVTFTNGIEQLHRIYSLVVKAEGEASISQMLDEDLVWAVESLKSAYSLGNIANNLILPTKAINGSNVTWTSSNPAVLSNSGTIVPQAQDTEVELKVKVAFSEEYREDTIKLVIKAKAAPAVVTPAGGSGGGGSGGGGSAGFGTTVVYDMVPNLNVFNDISEAHWAYDAVMELYNRKIVNGTGENSFEPDAFATREEFVKMLLLSKGIAPGVYETGFTDISSSEWYYTYVGAAKNAGIVKGVEENLFGVGQNITREDMSILIYRAFYNGEIAEEFGFNDSGKISGYAKNAVNVLCENGILKGDENGNFNPQDNATRAEIAMVLYRILGA